MLKAILAIFALSVLIPLAKASDPVHASAAQVPKSQAAFEQLSALVGEWKGEQDGIEVTLIYNLSTEGTALMEEFVPAKGPKMITMLTRKQS